MALVRIVKNWDWPDLMRQTPRHSGIWDGIEFTLDPVERCDYLIVLNQPAEDVTVQCPREHIWAIMQEPPNEHFKPMHRGSTRYHRVYTQDVDLGGKRYIHSHPALPWHVDKDYDYLASCGPPAKVRDLSWITSNIAVFQGQRARLRFLETIRGQVRFDLFGRGFAQIQDKWDGLAPYHYSLAVENFQNPYYWSEKIADCFLAWTMPLYHGCTQIGDYFPAEAFVRIDIEDPRTIDKIRDVVSSDLWWRNLDAIAHARRLVLDHHQLFPFVAREIGHYETRTEPETPAPTTTTISHQPLWPPPLRTRIRGLVVRVIPEPIRRLVAPIKNLLGTKSWLI